MTTKKREALTERIKQHGRNLLQIFPCATDPDPVMLCKKLRRLEAEAYAISLRSTNGPDYPGGYEERDALIAGILAKVNKLLGNVHECQPKTGAKCGCRRGVQRDNCAACEGTGYAVDFHAIRNRRPLVPVVVNLDARGCALKIDDEFMRIRPDLRLNRDWGGYGIIAPDLRDEN